MRDETSFARRNVDGRCSAKSCIAAAVDATPGPPRPRLRMEPLLTRRLYQGRGTVGERCRTHHLAREDRKSTRLNSSHSQISYAVFCLKKKKQKTRISAPQERQHNLFISLNSRNIQLQQTTITSHITQTSPPIYQHSATI